MLVIWLEIRRYKLMVTQRTVIWELEIVRPWVLNDAYQL